MLPNNVKLVIWDLDDTFWKGTLAEGAVQIPAKNRTILETLTKRGIVSSISSKNNFDNVRKVLEEHGLWSYFVFPQIEFAPKGESIARNIERMNLRPDNVLFIDDNHLNIEEAKYFSPKLMTAHPDEILPHILDLPETQGKNDADLSRLHQYKQLETKFQDQKMTPGSNEDFLRNCNITVEIDIEVESYFDRVVELVNRSNQLNYTKRRLETEAALDEFRKRLTAYGNHAGVVKAKDKYGDYGIVGFYMSSRTANCFQLIHFVFSCRIMSMGIEQYVYELLGRPSINIAPPVANGLDEFAVVNWINTRRDDADSAAASAAKLLLIGGCDLLQVATYCSINRSEFVNTVNRDVMVRYDDAGFVLSPREAVASSDTLPLLPVWTKDDVRRFDTGLAEADVIITSFWEMLVGDYMVLDDQILIRIDPVFHRKNIGRPDYEPRIEHARYVRLSVSQKLELIRRSLDLVSKRGSTGKLFVLGAPTRRYKNNTLELRQRYNEMAEAYCQNSPGVTFVSLDDVIPESEILDAQHFTRKGYFALASELIRQMHSQSGKARVASAEHYTEGGFEDILENSMDLAFVGDVLSPMPAPQTPDTAETQFT